MLTVVGDFMMNEIKKVSKAKKTNIHSINSANQAAACLVQYVNTVEQMAFQSIEEMKEHMAEKCRGEQ